MQWLPIDVIHVSFDDFSCTVERKTVFSLFFLITFETVLWYLQHNHTLILSRRSFR